MIELSESAIEAIDSYMSQNNEPLCLGWESFGFSTAYIHLKKTTNPERERIEIRLKNELKDPYVNFKWLSTDKKKERKLYEWFQTNNTAMWRIWNERNHCTVPIKVCNLRVETMMFFDEMGGKLMDIYIRQKYGTALKAVSQTENFVSLWNEFER